MIRLQNGARQCEVALKCECENLETIYIQVEPDGVLLVTDDHRTFQYLERGGDTAYVPTSELDMNAVRQFCDELNVEFKDAPADGYPSFECRVELNQPIAEAIAQVAEAVDRLFHLALKTDSAQ